MPARRVLTVLFVVVACVIVGLLSLRGAATQEIESAGTAHPVAGARPDTELVGPPDVDESVPAENGSQRSVVVSASSRAERSKRDRPLPTPPKAIQVPMRVHVVDERGLSIPGVRVQGRIGLEVSVRTVNAITDANGEAVIESAGCLRASLRFTPPESDFVHAAAEIELDACEFVVVVTLATRTWLYLTVLDPERKPVAQLDDVRLVRGSPVFPLARVEDASAGRHAIEVGTEPDKVRIGSGRSGWATYEFAVARPSTMSGVVVLARAGTIRVTTLHEGRVAAGVEVALVHRTAPRCASSGEFVFRAFRDWSVRVLHKTITDADGHVDIAIEEPGEYDLVASMQGLGAGEEHVVISAHSPHKVVVLPLMRGRELAVQLRDAERNPVVRTAVFLRGDNGIDAAAKTNDDGAWVFDSLLPARYTARAKLQSEYVDRHIDLIAGDDQRAELTLDPLTRLAVEVPVSQRDVELYADGCPPIRMSEGTRRRPPVVQLESGEVGRHWLVVREGRWAPRRSVPVVALDLVLGENAIVIEFPEREKILEVRKDPSIDSSQLRFRVTPRVGHEIFFVLSDGAHGNPPDRRDGKTRRQYVSASVPDVEGDLVLLDANHDVVVLVEKIRFERDEKRREVLVPPQ